MLSPPSRALPLGMSKGPEGTAGDVADGLADGAVRHGQPAFDAGTLD